ncbi:MAG TPA: response regulator [Candidatus Sulfotelmatobacter sp.]|nr:response regulator [Candidatus Sulfotelmatobacter sp.]
MARILVIDDDDDYRDYLVAVLERAGHSAYMLPNGASLEALVDRYDFDAVLTDLYMPEADGIETIRTLRRLAPGLPILGMTAGIRSAYGDVTVRAMKLFGAKGVLFKPVDPHELLAAVDATLRGEKIPR